MNAADEIRFNQPLDKLKTYCCNGHEYTEENTFIKNGRRACRICRNSRQRERNERMKQGIRIKPDRRHQTHCKRGHPFTDENTSIRKGKRHCRLCARYRKKFYRNKNKDAASIEDRKSSLKKNYNISIEDYEMMALAQGGVCAVCKTYPTRRRLDVDHNHKTGTIRGLLCEHCNKALGLLRDDPKLLLAAAAYIIGATIKEGAS